MLHMSRQMKCSDTPRKAGLSTCSDSLGIQWPSLQMSPLPPPPLPQFLLLSMRPYDKECPFGQFWSAVLSVPSPNSSCTPSSLLAGQYQKYKGP